MANCISCSAPLTGKSTICVYCGRRNDTDLRGIHKYTVMRPETERTCPRCDIPLQTLNLKKGDKFYIERCRQCMGLYFDQNELEALLEQSVSNVFRIDQKRLNTINKELYHRDPKQNRYVKCPVCRDYMKRANFGAKSGVIVDVCVKDGVWLDGGELKQLLEWKKAGGQLLHEKIRQKSGSSSSNDVTITSSDALAESIMNKERSRSKTRNNQWESTWSSNDSDDLVSSVFRLINRML